ncbi:MAG: flagellar basal body L-ring protein FlgH [Pseudomonadota bacterium]
MTLMTAAMLVCGCAQTQTAQIAPPSPYPPAPVYVDTTPKATVQTASLWTTDPTALLSMRRAKDVGDLLTVVVEMNDQANLQSSLNRSRSSSEDVNVQALFGLPQWLNNTLPGDATLSPGVDVDRSSELSGSGAVNRAEQITFRLAARVVGIEQSGNLIIRGYQQTLVGDEVRYLTVSGVIRAQDITRSNTVTYDKIANARMAYVSSGDTSNLNGRGEGAKVLDQVMPF